MEDVVAATAFIAALASLLLYAVAVASQFTEVKIVESPLAPAGDAPTRRVYVYATPTSSPLISSSLPVPGVGLVAVEYEGDVEELRRALGIGGVLVAVFEIYPGGYRCRLAPGVKSVRIGDDPYTGLWCPPPFSNATVAGCSPVGIASRGRWLVVQYSCP